MNPPQKIVSPAKLAANRANAARSTGPKSAEGKSRSRANAVKHGLSGAGVVQPPALEPELLRKAEMYAAALRPEDEVERDLVRSAALGAWRAEVAHRHERMAVRTHRARSRYEAAQALDAARNRLHRDPAGAVAELSRTLAGIDWMIGCWNELRGPIERRTRWSDAERERALNLLGFTDLEYFDTAVVARALAQADFNLAAQHPIHLIDRAIELNTQYRARGYFTDGQKAITEPEMIPTREASKALLRMIDEQLARLTQLRDALAEVEASEGAGADAEASALIDGPESEKLRRYESAARRALLGSLSRLESYRRQRRRDAEGGGRNEATGGGRNEATEPPPVAPAPPEASPPADVPPAPASPDGIEAPAPARNEPKPAAGGRSGPRLAADRPASGWRRAGSQAVTSSPDAGTPPPRATRLSPPIRP